MLAAAANPSVLVVDDDVSICRSCEKVLAGEGCSVQTVHSGQEALQLLSQQPVDVVIADLQMADVGVRSLLDALGRIRPAPAAVVITGHATITSVVETMKLGVFDYLSRPFTSDELVALVERAWEKRRAALHGGVEADLDEVTELAGLVGRSRAMRQVFPQIRKAAQTSGTVLIVGEPGTGHVDVARAIHTLGPRQHARFAVLACAGPSGPVLARELFGRVADEPDGPAADRPGVIESADRGTVVLDGIADLDVEVQAGLLRVIHERECLPVGASDAKRVNVRLILAASGDLERMVTDDALRDGFSSRVHVFPITLPPLRARREDVAPLASRLLERVAERGGWPALGVSDEALALLERYDWPGNLTELEHVIEHAAVTAAGGVIEPAHLPRCVALHGQPGAVTAVPRTNAELLRLKRQCREQAVAGLERDFVVEALVRHEWNVTRAAREVGLQRANFQALMRRHAVRSLRGR